METKYLYFPSCKIINVDKINLANPKIIFHLKSKSNTPGFYLHHPVLKGKAEFIYTIDCNLVENNSIYKKELTNLFNKDIINLKNIKQIKNTTLSLVAFLNPYHSVITDCFGIGKENSICNFFNIINPDNTELARMIYLDYQLSQDKTNTSKDEIVKI